MDAMDSVAAPTLTAGSRPRRALPWRSLRDWLALVEQRGELKRIAAPVDPDEELGAITLLATRQERSPALLFETMQGDETGSRILTNMLGASKERYALSVGIDPALDTNDMIRETRSLMAEPIPPVMIAKGKAAA